MTPLIVIGGNVGAGKTTLARQLGATGSFALGLESLQDRPFQALLATAGRRYALANQVDFLLERAEQERTLRSGRRPGLQDGGLEMDFHVFTRYFFERDLLSPPEYELCHRLYRLLRAVLPPPECYLFLHAPLEVVRHRYQSRGRSLEIAQMQDLARLHALTLAWRDSLPAERVLDLDATTDAFGVAALAERLQRMAT